MWLFGTDPLAGLLRKAQRGNRDAFRALFRELYPRVRAYCARRSHDPDEPVSRTFQKMLERLDSFDPRRGAVAPWVLSIARNELIDAARAERPAGELPELIDGQTPLSQLLEAEELEALRTELHRLDAATRELLALRFGEGLSHTDIAQMLGLSHAAVRQRISRAVRELRDALRTKGALT